MAIIKEYRCLAHGPFDSADGVCPSGCTTVVREFRTAPGGRSARTKGIDKTLEGMAARFGLTDMSNSGGESVGANRVAARGMNSMAPVWGNIPKGNVFEAGKGEVQVDGSQGGVTAALPGLGLSDANNSAVEAMAAANNVKLPTFTDIASALPAPKPVIHGSAGTAADLSSAIEKAA